MSAIGYGALFLALVASLYSTFAYAFGSKGKNPSLLVSARTGLVLSCVLVTLAVLVLLLALISSNFRIEYVSSYTSLDTSLAYRLSALWAGNEGSLLFWAWLTSIFAAIVIFTRRDKNRELVPYASAVMMFVLAFFLLLLVSVANPFHQLSFTPSDGRGLNPMLENPGMIFHPPALLAGYVGLTVPFAFAIAALWSRKLGNDWLGAVRSWALLAWLLLGVGNIIGAWWAYVELGWGGYWAWDPVENAGLMPWLLVTAFLHSVMIQRRRGMFKVWTMALVILSFDLAIFGTFITRSGVLSSVHSFGLSTMDPFFWVFMVIIFLGSLGFLFSRKAGLKSEADVDKLVSRESSFLLNNILLAGSTLIIFIGTVFPGLSEAFGGVRIEVGQTFFNRVNAPLFLVIILVAGFCTLMGWASDTVKKYLRAMLWPLLITVLLVVILFVLGVRQGYALVAAFICPFVFLAILFKWFAEVRQSRREGAQNILVAGAGLFWKNRPRYGGYLVHLSLVVMAVGVLGSSIYDVQQDVSLKQGESTTLQGYTLVFGGLDVQETPDKQVVSAEVSVYRGQDFIADLKPEKFFHRSFEQPVTEVAIRSTVAEDLYVILAGWDADGTAAFTILVNPLVIWLWIGGVIFLIGGIVAFWPGRPGVPAPKPDSAVAKKDVIVEDEIERQVRRRRRKPGTRK
ncbi:MAG: hypothetical protein A2Z29_02120 [Chloroflexi bacterium RBG_16_56_11]|nr:MAG: hypothetical protein A2Z29_02120 [Chloroflexi bacterium RBG_16_56_11]